MRLPPCEPGRDAAVAWVRAHLLDLCLEDDACASERFRGGQSAADAALGAYDVRGYAARRNEVWPVQRRGASALSPYIRHGLIGLRAAWDHVAAGPARDRAKFRDELLWQEYARHLYARVGARSGRALRHAPPVTAAWPDPWPRDMACVDLTVTELERDGWLVNQTRMWLASQWTVRAGWDWRAGEDRFFAHLLDGSRAANRLGWQWTVGAVTGRPYGFSRWQVRKRAPGLCERCARNADCPIDGWPAKEPAPKVPDPPAQLRKSPGAGAAAAGPAAVVRSDEAPDAVWLTAESLGADDPALAAHPRLPAVFVFDAPLLRRLALSSKRLVFWVETLAELAAGGRTVELWRGDPRDVVADRPLAATHAPVPGWRARAARLRIAAEHPWPWLVVPTDGPVASYSAWRRTAKIPSR